jgi:hypothetical protein
LPDSTKTFLLEEGDKKDNSHELSFLFYGFEVKNKRGSASRITFSWIQHY